jgi:hypothetical protein
MSVGRREDCGSFFQTGSSTHRRPSRKRSSRKKEQQKRGASDRRRVGTTADRRSCGQQEQ